MEQQYIKNMFNEVASNYDFLNHFLSLGIDKLWRKKVVKIVKQFNPKNILDLATGTGDFAIALSKIKPDKITGVDISDKMVEVGIQKVEKLNLSNLISFEIGASEKLNFAENTFDLITVGFGVRNYEDLKKGLSEMLRVIKIGGAVAILEFSKPKTFPFKQIYFFYFIYILPLIGRLISKHDFAYKYLPNSVLNFPEGDNFINILKEVGFVNVRQNRLSFGISTVYLGFK